MSLEENYIIVLERRSKKNENFHDMNTPDITDVPFIQSNWKEGSLRQHYILCTVGGHESRKSTGISLEFKTILFSRLTTVEGSLNFPAFYLQWFCNFLLLLSSASLSVASYTHRHQTIIFLMDRGVLKRERRNIYKKII